MRKILYIFKMSIFLLYIMLSSGCYTMINHPENGSDYQSHNLESQSDTLNTSEHYTIINNYTCNSEGSCCNHDYCHTNTNSNHYHSCSGDCSLTYNWWTSSWVSYSCNYCHHWSCSSHHHGNFYGHGYFYHDHHHNSYDYGYHDGFHDGYWWGYDDGWDDNEGNGSDYGDSGDDRIQRRDNSYNPDAGNEDTADENSGEDEDNSSNNITFSDRDLIIQPTLSNVDSVYNTEMVYDREKNIDNNSSSNINYKVILEKERDQKTKTKTKKRSSGAFDLAKILFSTISSSKGSKKDKNSASKSKGSKKDKSSKKKESDTSKSSSKSKNNSKKSSSIKHRR